MSRDDSSDGMSITHRFANGHDVRNEIVSIKLEGPHVAAHATEANLNLVGDADTTSCAHVSVEERRKNRSITLIVLLADLVSEEKTTAETYLYAFLK